MKILEDWLVAGTSKESISNRAKRFEYVRAHLPPSPSFLQVCYQILHRCAGSETVWISASSICGSSDSDDGIERDAKFPQICAKWR